MDKKINENLQELDDVGVKVDEVKPPGQAIVPGKKSENLDLAELNGQQKDFIENLLSTGDTYISYLKAGYKGSYKAAYELRRQLLKWIAELAGCTAADVFRSLRELEDMPVTEHEVTFGDKLALIKFKAKLAGMVNDQPVQARQFSTFVIQRFGESAGPKEQSIVDIPMEGEVKANEDQN